MHNLYVNDVRRSSHQGTQTSLYEVPTLPIDGNAIPTLELKDLEVAIASLPTEQRIVVLLVGLEGMADEEVASILNVPVATVRSRLSRARELLKRLIGMKENAADNPDQALIASRVVNLMRHRHAA